MIEAIAIAVSLGAGLPLPYVAFLGLSVWAPWLGLVAAAVVVVRERSAVPADAEVAYLAGVAAQLGAGLSLRHALATACDQAPSLDLDSVARVSKAGRPLGDVAGMVEDRLPTQGETAAAAIRLASTAGGPIAPVFEMLSSRAASDLELRREIRTGTAAARFSALIIGGGPLVLVVLNGARGDLTSTGTSFEALLVVVGVLLIAVGSATVWLMLRRATR